MTKKIRRVVTGHNEEGKSVIISDGYSSHVLALPEVEDFALTNLWVTDRSPADNAGHADAAGRPVVLEPPPGGTIFRIVEFPPDKGLGRALRPQSRFRRNECQRRDGPGHFSASGDAQDGDDRLRVRRRNWDRNTREGQMNARPTHSAVQPPPQ